MKRHLDSLREQARKEIASAENLQQLRDVEVRYLGKKGELTKILRGMGDLAPEERPEAGRLANETREHLEGLLASKEESLGREAVRQRLAKEQLDVTLPGTRPQRGAEHPIYKVLADIRRIFTSMGFDIASGPEVETEFYNFEALNIPADHPARDMQQSFYLCESILLRTQTSPVQIRAMQRRAPKVPLRILAPGRCFRRDHVDATHGFMFHQIEGLVIDYGITMQDLKGTLETFVRELYGEGTEIRLRPSYFPFTEPSAEADMTCMVCHGSGCRVCKDEGFIELGGAGMVHPRVLEIGGYDPETVSGFAFGWGVERMAQFKYDINDLRLFFNNDARFLRQFR